MSIHVESDMAYDELEDAVRLMNTVRQAIENPSSGHSGVEKLILEFCDAIRAACQRATGPIRSAQAAAVAEQLKDPTLQDYNILQRGKKANAVVNYAKELEEGLANKASFNSTLGK